MCDVELYIDDEFLGDFLVKIKDSFVKCYVGLVFCFVYDFEMFKEFLEFFKDVFELENYDMFKEGCYYNNFDFFQFFDFGMINLKNLEFLLLLYVFLEKFKDYFGVIS